MWRTGFILGLACILAWASGPMAVARATMAGSITVCTGDGVRVIMVDGDGTAVSGHPCPDCSLAAPALLPAFAASAAFVATGCIVQTAPRLLRMAATQPLYPVARGPPPLT